MSKPVFKDRTQPVIQDLTSSVTTVIRAPLNVVWPYVLDQALWMREFKIESIAGQPNTEGEIKKVMHLEPCSEDFFFKTLLLVPFRRFVYKAYTENCNGQYGFTGIEILSLSDLGKDTGVTFEAYLEIQSAAMTREELAHFVTEAREGSIAMWARNFERLTSLVDGSNAGASR